MNRIYICFLSLALLAFWGCVEQQKAGPTSASSVEPQAIEGKTDNKFPEFLVGVWKSDQYKGYNWGFKFEEDGKISKLTHILGAPIKVSEGSYYEEGAQGASFLYVLGPCETNYDPKTKILKVSVVLDYFLMDMPGGSIEGSQKDTFEGPVSAKDLVWDVKWRCYAQIEGETSPDVSYINANPETLVFRKVDLKALEEHKHEPNLPAKQVK
jgi:hypothetical protein